MESETCVPIVEIEEDQTLALQNPTPLDCDEVGLVCHRYDGSWIYDGSVSYC